MQSHSQTKAPGVTERPARPAARALSAFAALGQPTRLAMLKVLVGSEPVGMSVGDLADVLRVPKNTASSHLAVLSRAELVVGERKGRLVIYRADLAGVQWLIHYLLADCCNGDPAACSDLLPGVGMVDGPPHTNPCC